MFHSLPFLPVNTRDFASLLHEIGSNLGRGFLGAGGFNTEGTEIHGEGPIRITITIAIRIKTQRGRLAGKIRYSATLSLKPKKLVKMIRYTSATVALGSATLSRDGALNRRRTEAEALRKEHHLLLASASRCSLQPASTKRRKISGSVPQ